MTDTSLELKRYSMALWLLALRYVSAVLPAIAESKDLGQGRRP